MPIYDSNGSVLSEIKTIYDNNGSANTQIGKVYDNNSSANSLIYTAQSPSNSVILNANDQVSAVTGGWVLPWMPYAYKNEISANGIYQSFSANNTWGIGYAYTANPIEISGWNTLNTDVSWYGGYGDAARRNGTIYIGLTSEISTSSTWNPPWIVHSEEWCNGVGGSGTSALSVNVSSISGAYYVVVYRKVTATGGTFTSTFKKIYFS